MRFVIKHESKGRIRVHMVQNRMSYRQADILCYYLQNISGVTSAKVYENTSDAMITYTCNRSEVISAFKKFAYDKVDVPSEILDNSGRELNSTYREKLINKVVLRYARKLFLPYPLNACTHVHVR